MTTPPSDAISLLTGGHVYTGWTSMRLGRAINRMGSHFSLAVSERWAGQVAPWRIDRWAPVQMKLGNDIVFTGYVDHYTPELSDTTRSVSLAGRSKTEDLIDCMPDVPSGQFVGYALPAIARALAAPFGIEVVDQTGSTPGTAQTAGVLNAKDTRIERAQTAQQFLDRLCKLSGVLHTDDELGRLVLTRTGSDRADDRLASGVNIKLARMELKGDKRWSIYIVKGQSSLTGGVNSNWNGAADRFVPTAGAKVVTQQRATAADTSVPRYRPHVTIAESQLDSAGMQARADWLARSFIAKSEQLHVTVAGWRQASGALWKINEIVSVSIPEFGLDEDLLIASVDFEAGSNGLLTAMVLGPPDAYTPDPASLKLKKGKKGGHGGAGPNWNGAAGVTKKSNDAGSPSGSTVA